MPYNEADTRAKLIDPAIHKCSWTENLIRREETAGAVEIIGVKARRRLRGKGDYVLRVKLNPETQPVAVALIEAKKGTLPPLPEQKRIAAILNEQMAAEEEFATINALPAALLRRAFAGAL
jgi:type I site-specific restriction endonuclease